jgi:uncharacterized protein (DUF302 family)
MTADTSVTYGSPGSAAGSFQSTRTVPSPLAVVVDDLLGAIEKAGFWVLHQIDPQALLRRDGYVIDGARQILFFHPRFVTRILSADPSAILEAPLKIALMETSPEQTVVRWLDPAQALGRYENDALSELGRELSVHCEAIVQDALAGTKTREIPVTSL